MFAAVSPPPAQAPETKEERQRYRNSDEGPHGATP